MPSHRIDRRARLKSLQRICRERGVPLTVQRRVIFEALIDRMDHPTADDVYADVQDRLPGISRATVYRVLETLVRLGVIGKASHRGSAARYDASTDRHHHLVCVRCERTVDLDDPALDNLRIPNTRRLGFKIADYSIHFTGLCRNCARSARAGMHAGPGPSNRLNRRRRAT